MARTDVHRPSAPDFDPESYVLLGVFDLHPEWPTGELRTRMEIINEWIAKGYSFAGAPHSAEQCDHCGAHIRYEALTAHEPTRTLIEFGETCLDNRLGETAESFAALRAESERRRKITREQTARNETLTRVREWLAAEGTNPLLVELSYQGNGGIIDGNYFLADIARKLHQYGDLSPRQESAVVTAIGRDMDRQARAEQREREDAARQATASPAPSGRVQVVGTVGATWTQDGAYGTSCKWRVTTDAGYVVKGTIPAGLLPGATHDELRGQRVTFTATLAPTGDDPTTAWANRPTKARVTA